MNDELLSRAKLAALREDINKALDAVAKKHNLDELRAGNCSFAPTGGSFTFKLNGLAGGGLTKEASDYDANREWKNLPKRGETFDLSGKTFTIEGLKTRATKLPIICSGSDGKSYKFAEDTIRNHF